MTESMRQAEIYPEDAIAANRQRLDVIDPASLTSLPALVDQRIKRSGERPAYQQYRHGEWKTWSWQQFGDELQRWRKAFAAEGLEYGDRVVIRHNNSIEWVWFDQGAMGAGLVVVPVFAEDRADNIGYIVERVQGRLILVSDLAQWQELREESDALASIQRVVVIDGGGDLSEDPRLVSLEQWLESASAQTDPFDSVQQAIADGDGADALATIVFTSGTTGKPKGVMLSHDNIMQNAWAGLRCIAVFPEDRMLSFLPLSHMLERTAGCYLSVMAGSSVAFNRSIPDLMDDLAAIRPTLLITVPRIFERAYNRIREQLDAGSAVKRWLFDNAVEAGWQKFEIRQGRANWSIRQLFQPLLSQLVGSKVRQRFGGNLRFVISGGAPLSRRISRVFIGLGVEVLQGYGLTESSPVLTVNTLERNRPDSIGLPVPDTELRLNDQDELEARGPGIMLGYYNDAEATDETITSDGWLRTGDVASISEDGFVSITGRIKEIIVMANGEKLPPSDMESAICDHSLFEQAMVVGEGKSYLSAIVVLNPDSWEQVRNKNGFPDDLENSDTREWAIGALAKQVEDFPGYANIHAVTLTLEPWTVEGGMLTPTMKLKRPAIRQQFEKQIERMYEGH